METNEVDLLVKELSAGFEALQDEYQKLHGQQQALERKLATAREQYNELSKLYRATQTATPPLSLSSGAALPEADAVVPGSASAILETSDDSHSRDAAAKVKAATIAASRLRHGLPKLQEREPSGVRIWSGPAADTPHAPQSKMPSISECALEQDFTVEGKPSKLGCPFASMVNKKLSSHAASVLSRYNRPGAAGGTVSRINGRDSLSQRPSGAGSIVDPIKAEICGLSDHDDDDAPVSEASVKPPADNVDGAEAGVCPIRFMDQHSPEEVATYFEKHKHELPRSHEVCVMRYQSNEEQIKKLDAKYGNLVSMIQGLGAKHKDMLPTEPDDAADDEAALDPASDEKVRKWASSVSAQAPGVDVDPLDENASAERQPRFARPLREIRVGESPSRPWGISVPAKYLEKAENDESSNKPARVDPTPPRPDHTHLTPDPGNKAKCPFDHRAAAAAAAAAEARPKSSAPVEPRVMPNGKDSGDAPIMLEAKLDETSAAVQTKSPMVFTGPVFIGYSIEDAMKVLSQSGPRGKQ